MIFTALTAYPLTKLLQRIISLRDKSSRGGKAMPNVKKTFYSVRMRAAQGGPHEQGGIHISGAERIVAKNELETTIKQLLLRAQNHTKGSPDFINFNVEELQAENIFFMPLLYPSPLYK